jgi:hypothetical protein
MSTKWRKGSLSGLAVAALGLTIVLSLRPREPQCQGKSLTAWSRELPQPDAHLLLEGPATDDATKALQQMGTQSVPFLVGMLHARDSVASLKCKDFFNELFASHSSIRIRFTYASEQRVDALKAIFAIGPAAKAAIPEAKKLLDEGTEPDRVLIALAGIEPEAIPVLIQALTNRSEGVRAGAAGSLTWFRGQGQLIVPALVGCLSNTDPQIRLHVITPWQCLARNRGPHSRDSWNSPEVRILLRAVTPCAR